MIAPIGPGDFVEFVGRPRGYVNPCGTKPYGGLLVQGSVHIVTEVGRRCEDGAGQIWDSIRVRGLLPPHSIPLLAFRPIYRPDESLLTKLLQPVPADVEPVNA